MVFKSEYPIQKLLFFVAQDVDDNIRLKIKGLVEKLATQYTWQINAPQYVDVSDDARSLPEDINDITVGGVLEIYSAAERQLPHQIDLHHLREVEQIIKSLQELSQIEGLDFEFELDGSYVGSIEAGKLDRALNEGLLGEWRSHLGV